ncbi:type II secretion system F family protein [Armatimonas sp.]|uniref:type II secretion system F family protein n=1 Tax=Armatimonas sp. TaxID=1872638 RepID=UPI00286B5AE0|nr:type II secretion system F family protein [Armatimonas sp.]
MAALSFSYTAMDASGAQRTGVIEAETKEAALARLDAEGRFVLEINEAKSSVATAGSSFGGRRAPSRQELALFTRRLADLSLAGLPLDRVLQVVSEQSESQVLSEVCEQTLEDVRSGMPVSQALSKHPKFFNEVFTQTLRAGEASGQFPEVAGRLADFQEKEVARRSQISGALVYPAILASTAVFVVLFLLLFVVPRLSGVFKSLGNDLPLTTKMLLASTDFITQNWILVLVVLIGGSLLVKGWLATANGAYLRDKFMLKAPLIGPVVMKATISRFARVLGTLVYGGVPILEALDIAGLSAGNRVFQLSAKEVSEEVRNGRPIAEAMQDTGTFPPVLTHMVAIGEETGDLPRMLGRVSDSLDFEVDTGMRRLVSMVEPVIVLTMGTFVGFVVLSVLLPIFQAQETIK